MNEVRKTADNIDTLLLICSIGVLLLCLIAGCMVIPQVLFSSGLEERAPETYNDLTLWSVLTLLLFAIPTGIISLRAMRGHSVPRLQIPSISPYILVVLFLIALILGEIVFEHLSRAGPLGLFAHVTSAAIPASFAILLAYRFGPQISQRRFWGSLLLGVWVIPLSAIIIELILIIIGFTTFLIGNLSAPGWQTLFDAATNPEKWASDTMLEGFLPILNQPSFIILVLAFTCILVPILEESLKTMAIWPLLRRKLTQSETFLSGILGGAGFAFVEALFGTPSGPDWSQTMFVRGGATMMHTFTAGLTCWGIGRVVSERRWKDFLGAFTAAIVMHGLWNAAAIGVSVGSLSVPVEAVSVSPTTAEFVVVLSIFVLLSLTGTAITGMIEMPRRLHAQQELATPAGEVVAQLAPSTRPDESPHEDSPTPQGTSKPNPGG